jgi:glycogen operon protein
VGRTQKGNNNAYCQDNEISWIDWNLDAEKRTLLNFTTKLVRFRLTQPTLRRRRYFQGRDIRGGTVKDVAWLAPDGREMTDETWNADVVRSIGMLLNGSAIEELNERGEPIIGDSLLALLNGHSEKVAFTLPPLDENQQWRLVVDTFEPHAPDRSFRPGGRYSLQGRSVAIFKATPPIRDRRRRADALASAEPALIGLPDPVEG